MAFISKYRINLLTDIWVPAASAYWKGTEISNCGSSWGSIETNEKSEHTDNQYKYVRGTNVCSHMLSVFSILSHLTFTCKVAGITVIVDEKIVVQRESKLPRVTQLKVAGLRFTSRSMTAKPFSSMGIPVTDSSFWQEYQGSQELHLMYPVLRRT